jgi:hypothetical protein
MISKYAKLVEMLTRNFIKTMRRQPNNLENLKIKQQAAETIRQEQKIIPFKYKKTFGEEIKEMEQKGVGSLFKKTAETEDEILARLNKQNRDTIEKIKSRKQKTAEEMMDEGDFDPSGFAGGGKVENKSNDIPLNMSAKYSKGNNNEILTYLASLDIPVSEKIKLLGEVSGIDVKSEQDFNNIKETIGLAYNKDGDGISGLVKIDTETGEPFYQFKYSKKFAGGGLITKGITKLIKTLSRVKNKSKLLTDDQIRDIELDLGDSETWLSKGTIEEALEAAKRQKDEIEYYYGQYKTGKLDPKPGEVNRSRLDFLKRRAEEAEMSGDRRLITGDELDELDSLEKRFEYLDLEDKAQNISRKMTDEEIQKLKEINDSGYVDFQKEMDRITRTKKAEGGITSIIGSDLDEEEDMTLGFNPIKAVSGLANPKNIGRLGAFIFSGGLSSGAEAAAAAAKIAAKEKAAQMAADKIAQQAAQRMTQQSAQRNQYLGEGGYQSSWGGVSDFMSGSGTSADMGSFKKGGSVKKSIRERIINLVGGPSAAAAELGLEGILQIYDLLGMPLFAKGGLAKNKLTDTVPPEKGPDSQGVESLFRRK